MTKQKKQFLACVFVTVILIIVARVLRLMINNMESPILPTFLIYLRGMIHLSLALVWTISVYNRITNKQTRALVLSVDNLKLLGILLKTEKQKPPFEVVFVF